MSISLVKTKSRFRKSGERGLLSRNARLARKDSLELIFLSREDRKIEQTKEIKKNGSGTEGSGSGSGRGTADS